VVRVLTLLVCACPRNLLKGVLKDLQEMGSAAMAGIEYEFCNTLQTTWLMPLDHFDETPQTLAKKRGHDLTVTFPHCRHPD